MSRYSELVSVVVPSFNHASYILTAVESVLSQTHRNLECIIVDDGSTDDTVNLLKAKFSSDRRVTIITRENRGAHNTINEALDLGKGDFFAILNSDDYYFPDRIEKMLCHAHEFPDYSLYISEVEIVDEFGARAVTSGPLNYYNNVLSKIGGHNINNYFHVGNLAMTTSNFFFTRNAYKLIGPFRPFRYVHDWDWILRANRQLGVSQLKEKLINYRVHTRNTISEGNIWAHISENASIFAIDILGNLQRSSSHSSSIAQDKFLSLLENESFLPLPVLYLILTKQIEEQILKSLENGSLAFELEQVYIKSGLTFEAFLSLQGGLPKQHTGALFSKMKNKIIDFVNKI